MIGIRERTPRIILQDRDRRLLASLSRIRAATATQLAAIGAFTSRTRINARLRQLCSAGYLCRDFIGTISGGRTAVYMLAGKRIKARSGPAGFEAAVQHQLAISDVYVAVEQEAALGRLVASWHEPRDLLTPSRLIPDAEVVISADGTDHLCFLEIDLGTEGIAIWRHKIARYLSLAHSSSLEGQIGSDRFRVLVVASSESQARRIQAAASPSTEKVFWISTIQSIASAGFGGPIWLRPQGQERHALI
jgi:hypothetical protein